MEEDLSLDPDQPDESLMRRIAIVRLSTQAIVAKLNREGATVGLGEHATTDPYL